MNFFNKTGGKVLAMLVLSVFLFSFVAAVEVYYSPESKMQHNNLGGKQGTGTDYYHLNATEYANLLININGSNSLYRLTTNHTFYGEGGDVGIGTATPQKNLQVEGITPIIRLADSNAATDAAATAWLEFYRGNNANRMGYMGYGSGSNEYMYINNENSDGEILFLNAGSEKMRLDESGNVGIGTASPSDLLHVSGTGTTDRITIQGGEASTTTGGGNLRFIGFNAASGVAGYGEINLITPAGGDGELAFKTTTAGSGGLTEQMRIDKDGDVGIGTASPTNKLDVVDTSAGAETLPLLLRNAHVNTNTEVGIGFIPYTGDTVLGKITQLHTGVGTYDLTFETWSSGALGEVMRMQSGGNVGIGTTIPQHALQVGELAAFSTATPDTISLGGTFSSTAGSNPKLRVWSNSIETQNMGLGVSSGRFEYISGDDAFDHVWYDGSNNELMYLDSGTGNLGINTTSPKEALDVNGNIITNSSSNTMAADTFNSAIIGGSGHTIANSAYNDNIFMGGGTNNQCDGRYGACLGGSGNDIVSSAFGAFVGGGLECDIDAYGGDYSGIVGGNGNTIQGAYNFLGGGTVNLITGNGAYGGIVGGHTNKLQGDYSFIGAGRQNDIDTSTIYASIVGGYLNNLSNGDYSVIAGGQSNKIVDAIYSIILGGLNNYISTDYSAIVGGSGNIINGTHNKAIMLGTTNRVSVASDTTHVENLYAFGNITGNNIYGSLNGQDSGVVSLASANVYYNVTNITSGLTNGVIASSSTLTIQSTGTYRVFNQFAFSGSASQEYHLALGVGGVVNQLCHTERVIGSGGDVGSASYECYIALVEGQVLTSMIENVDSAGDPTIHNIQLNIERIGN